MPSAIPNDPGCADCEQGKQVADGNYTPWHEELEGDQAGKEKTKICANKDCPSGGKPLPLSAFYHDRRSTDGHRCYCKECDRERTKQYRLKKKEKDQETRICSHPDCPWQGKPQPISNFNRHSKHGYQAYCRECQKRMIRLAAEQAEAEKALAANRARAKRVKHEDAARRQAAREARKAGVVPSGLALPANSLVIDFSIVPDVFRKIRKIAERELRTPENMVLFILKKEIDRWEDLGC